MKIFNKFVESKKEPSNKNDIWFDGSTIKLYKEGKWYSITLSKEEIEQLLQHAENADWNAREWEAGYIENRTHSATFTRIEYNQENNKGKYEVAGFEDKLLLLWRKKYFTVHKNIPLTIDVNDGEDTFIVNYNGTTLYITDNNGYLYDEHEYISVSETYIPLTEAFIPDTVLKTTPQELSDANKNQALSNLGIDPVVWKYMCNPIKLVPYGNCPSDAFEPDPDAPDTARFKLPLSCFSRIFEDDYDERYIVIDMNSEKTMIRCIKMLDGVMWFVSVNLDGKIMFSE